MNAIQIEMFSKLETIVFGIAMLTFVLSVLFLYALIEGATKLIRERNERDRLKQKAEKTYKVERTDFEELATKAIQYQRMQSFITETSAGRKIEFTVDEILEEVKERQNDKIR